MSTRNTHVKCGDIVNDASLCDISSFDDGTNFMKRCFSTERAKKYVIHEAIPNHEHILTKLNNMPECSTIGNAVKRFWGNKRQGKTFDEFKDFHQTLPWGKMDGEEITSCVFHKIAKGDEISFNDYKNHYQRVQRECQSRPS